MVIQQSLQLLRQFKLRGFAEALEQQLAIPSLQQQLSFEERLGLLLDREREARQNRLLADLLKKAKLRYQACMEDIDYRPSRGLDKSLLMSLARGDFIRRHHNVFITGSTGCGKSWMACAIGQLACRLGFSVRYWRMSRLMEEWRVSHVNGSYPKQVAQLAKMDLLILDDFGLDPLSAQDRRDCLEVLEDRYQRKSTLIASQLNVEQWHPYLGEPTIADAIMDRIVPSSFTLNLQGGSLRSEKK
jgi:DNA replication protein DnaC